MQAYISNYTSHTKIYRLLFIAERNQGRLLELEALKLAADEVKQVVIATLCAFQYSQAYDRYPEA